MTWTICVLREVEEVDASESDKTIVPV